MAQERPLVVNTSKKTTFRFTGVVQNLKGNKEKDCIKSVFKMIVRVKDVSVKNIYDVQSTNIKMKEKKVQSCGDRADMFHMCLSGLHTVITTTGSKMDQHRKIQSFWHQLQTLQKKKKTKLNRYGP